MPLPSVRTQVGGGARPGRHLVDLCIVAMLTLSTSGCFTIVGSVTGAVIQGASSDLPDSLEQIEPGDEVAVHLRDGRVLRGEHQGYNEVGEVLLVRLDVEASAGEVDAWEPEPTDTESEYVPALAGFELGTIAIPTTDIESVTVSRIDPVGTGALIGATLDVTILALLTGILLSGPIAHGG